MHQLHLALVRLQGAHLAVWGDGPSAIYANRRILFAKLQEAILADNWIKKKNFLIVVFGLGRKRFYNLIAFLTMDLFVHS